MASREELASAVRTIATILKSDPEIEIVRPGYDYPHIRFSKIVNNSWEIHIMFDMEKKIDSLTNYEVTNKSNITATIIESRNGTTYSGVSKVYSIQAMLAHICTHFRTAPIGIKEKYNIRLTYQDITKTLEDGTSQYTEKKIYSCNLPSIPEEDWEYQIVNPDTKRPHLIIRPTSVTRVPIT